MQARDAAAARSSIAPARARFWRVLALLLSLGVSASTFAQAQQPVALQIETSEKACLRTDILRARIAHYLARKPVPAGLRVVVDVEKDADSGGAELRIYRDRALLSLRRFERLPAACEDRRDAVALSIALALEDPAVTEARTEERDRAAAPAAPSGSEPSGAASESSAGSARSRDATASIRPEREDTDSVASPERPARDGKLDTADTTRANIPSSHTTTTSGSDSREPVILGTLPDSVSHTGSLKESLGLQLQLGARWLAEALPFPVWVGSAGLALQLSQRVSVGLSAQASTLGETRFETGRARGRLYGLEAVGCSLLALGPAALELCAGAAVAACEVGGRDYPMPRPDTTLLWAAALARAALRWPAAGTLAVRALLQGHGNIRRPMLEVARASRTLAPSWLGVTTGIELVVTLP